MRDSKNYIKERLPLEQGSQRDINMTTRQDQEEFKRDLQGSQRDINMTTRQDQEEFKRDFHYNKYYNSIFPVSLTKLKRNDEISIHI